MIAIGIPIMCIEEGHVLLQATYVAIHIHVAMH